MSAVDRPADPSPDRLVAIIVNYNSGAFCEAAVGSLRFQWEREGRDPSDLQVIVVENASTVDQSEHLDRIAAAGVPVHRAPENLGYARGMTFGYEHATWPADGKREFVAMCNPDLVFLEGAIGAMLGFLAAHPDVGMVTPRAHIDLAQVIHLPRNNMPTPWDSVELNLAHRFAWAGRRYATRRLKASIPWMETEEPIDATALSGACMFVRRELVEDLGYLLDPRYPLYFEDTDLFRTIARRGQRTVLLPEAHVLHHWSRSAGFDEDFEDGPAQRYAISHRLYYQKFYGKFVARLVRWMDALGERWAARGVKEMVPVEPLEPTATSPTFRWDRERRVVLELGLTPNWLIAGGIRVDGDSFTFPEDTWDWLFQGRYFIRVVDRDTLEHVAAWRVDKTTQARQLPVRIDELAARFEGGVHAS